MRTSPSSTTHTGWRLRDSLRFLPLRRRLRHYAQRVHGHLAMCRHCVIHRTMTLERRYAFKFVADNDDFEVGLGARLDIVPRRLVDHLQVLWRERCRQRARDRRGDRPDDFGHLMTQQMVTQLFHSSSPPRAAPATCSGPQNTVSKAPVPRSLPPGGRGRAFVATHTTRKPTSCGVG